MSPTIEWIADKPRSVHAHGEERTIADAIDEGMDEEDARRSSSLLGRPGDEPHSLDGCGSLALNAGMIYKLTQTTTVGANSSAEGSAMVDIREDDTILGFTIDLNRDAYQVDGSYYAELSFISTSQVAENDTQGVIHHVVIIDADNAADVSNGSRSASVFVTCPPIAIASGERIYLHVGGKNTGGAAPASVVGTAYLHTGKSGTRRATRRR